MDSPALLVQVDALVDVIPSAIIATPPPVDVVAGVGSYAAGSSMLVNACVPDGNPAEFGGLGWGGKTAHGRDGKGRTNQKEF